MGSSQSCLTNPIHHAVNNTRRSQSTMGIADSSNSQKKKPPKSLKKQNNGRMKKSGSMAAPLSSFGGGSRHHLEHSFNGGGDRSNQVNLGYDEGGFQTNGVSQFQTLMGQEGTRSVFAATVRGSVNGGPQSIDSSYNLNTGNNNYATHHDAGFVQYPTNPFNGGSSVNAHHRDGFKRPPPLFMNEPLREALKNEWIVGRDESMGSLLQHISEREPDDWQEDPSLHPTTETMFMEKSMISLQSSFPISTSYSFKKHSQNNSLRKYNNEINGMSNNEIPMLNGDSTNAKFESSLPCSSSLTMVMKKASSTSTIYLDESTVSQPNLKTTIKCVSLAIYYHIKNRKSLWRTRRGGEEKHGSTKEVAVRNGAYFGGLSSRIGDNGNSIDILGMDDCIEYIDGYDGSSRDDEIGINPCNPEIFDEMFHPLTHEPVNGDYNTRNPEHRHIYRFMRSLFSAAQLTAECAIITLVYLERLLKFGDIEISPGSWKRMTLGAILLASKVWDDQAVWNVDYCQIMKDLTVEDMNELERQFLEMLQFNINVPSSVYAKYYFDLRFLSEISSLATPSTLLTVQRAHTLEAMSTPTACRHTHEYGANSPSSTTAGTASDGVGGSEGTATSSPSKSSSSNKRRSRRRRLSAPEGIHSLVSLTSSGEEGFGSQTPAILS